ncbi:CACTA en-spm transposon protein [Cucumis melo var. makuwa]|uniref:CACTA en-spm transposon protein n=1 Tax=Cucumis melo var. makuwa TaxID=1194695 RepID=A0A5D3C513_CUCMM|nr:CACTA en-spm transposon protein [Cucumis melo var. makuwa]
MASGTASGIRRSLDTLLVRRNGVGSNAKSLTPLVIHQERHRKKGNLPTFLCCIGSSPINSMFQTNEEKIKEKLSAIEEEKPRFLAVVALTVVSCHCPSPAVCRHTFLVEGVTQFLEFAKFHIDAYGRLRCLCKRCVMSSSYPCNNFLETDTMFLKFANNLDNLTGGSSSVGDNSANGRIPMTIVSGAEKPIYPHTVRFSQAIGVYVRKTFSVRCLKWADVGREYIEVVKTDLQRFFVFDFNDQAMNRFVEHQMLNTFKEFQGDCHRHFKKSNHGRTRLLDRSNLTIIAVGQSRFYNDNTSTLSKEGSGLTVWSYFRKYTFEPGRSCRRSQRMRIIKCWNFSPSLLQRVVNHPMGMRYTIRCWVDNQTTQKALVGDPSRRPARR